MGRWTAACVTRAFRTACSISHAHSAIPAAEPASQSAPTSPPSDIAPLHQSAESSARTLRTLKMASKSNGAAVGSGMAVCGALGCPWRVGRRSTK